MTQGILSVLALALLPAAGNFVGGLISEFRRPSPIVLNRALHIAAGVIIAVVAVEVMPEAIGHRLRGFLPSRSSPGAACTSWSRPASRGGSGRRKNPLAPGHGWSMWRSPRISLATGS